MQLIQYHTFETRLVKCKEDYAFYRLSKDVDGMFYFISTNPISCRLFGLININILVDELKLASTLPVLEWDNIKIIGVSHTI